MELDRIINALAIAAVVLVWVFLLQDTLLYKPKHSDERGYTIETAENQDGATQTQTAAAEVFSIAALLSQSNAEKGKKVLKKCKACHTSDEGGKHLTGPNLWNIVGRSIGSESGFSYSSSMKNKGGNWDYEALYYFLKNPKKAVPGTKMVFAGLKKDAQIADLLAYLRNQSNNPVPFPTE